MTDCDYLFKKPSPFSDTFNKNNKHSHDSTNMRAMQPKNNDPIDFNRIPIQTPSSPNTDYNHKQEMAKLEEMNKTLLEIKEKLTKTSVGCHLLEIDLVSQYNPHYIQTLKKTEQACKSCLKTLDYAEI